MSDKSSIAADGDEPDPLLHEALDWVVRLKTGEPTRDDVDALQRWRAQSPAHEEAFKTAVRIFRHAGVAAQELSDPPVAPSIVPAAPAIAPAAASSPSRTFARRAFLGSAIAAATAGYLAVNPPLGLWPSLEELSADYRTGKGEHRKIEVATDVSLELNTQTSIALRATQDQTRIELISGEVAVGASSAPSRLSCWRPTAASPPASRFQRALFRWRGVGNVPGRHGGCGSGRQIGQAFEGAAGFLFGRGH